MLWVSEADAFHCLKHAIEARLRIGSIKCNGDHVDLVFDGAVEMREDPFGLLIRRILETSQIGNIQGRECVTCHLQGAFRLVEKDRFCGGAGGCDTKGEGKDEEFIFH